MGKPKKSKPAVAKGRNSDRRCGKSFKKNPGVSPGAHSGKTAGGYSPAKMIERSERRSLARMAADL